MILEDWFGLAIAQSYIRFSLSLKVLSLEFCVTPVPELSTLARAIAVSKRQEVPLLCTYSVDSRDLLIDPQGTFRFLSFISACCSPI